MRYNRLSDLPHSVFTAIQRKGIESTKVDINFMTFIEISEKRGFKCFSHFTRILHSDPCTLCNSDNLAAKYQIVNATYEGVQVKECHLYQLQDSGVSSSHYPEMYVPQLQRE